MTHRVWLGWKILLAVIVCGGSAWAERALTWDSSVIEVVAAKGDKKAEAVYSFTNNSKDAVKIQKISTSCGCTAATADKKEIPAGGSGSVRARFVFGKRKGHQVKTIIVKTSQLEASRYILTFRVEIPDGR